MERYLTEMFRYHPGAVHRMDHILTSPADMRTWVIQIVEHYGWVSVTPRVFRWMGGGSHHRHHEICVSWIWDVPWGDTPFGEIQEVRRSIPLTIKPVNFQHISFVMKPDGFFLEGIYRQTYDEWIHRLIAFLKDPGQYASSVPRPLAGVN